MTKESSLQTMKLRPGGLMEQIRVDGWTWVNGGAVCGLCLGIISPIIGSALTAIAWFTGPEWHGLHLQRTGTVLFVLTFALLAFGAHCLDLSDRQDKEARKSHSN